MEISRGISRWKRKVTSNPDDRVPSRSRSTDRDVNQRTAFDFWRRGGRDATGNIS